MTLEQGWDALGEVPVVDSEGKELGTFGGVRAEYLKVKAPHAFDYWIPIDTVGEAHSEGIRLKVDQETVDKRKNLDEAEDMTDTELEEATDDLPHSIPVERRYDAQAEYLIRPHQ